MQFPSFLGSLPKMLSAKSQQSLSADVLVALRRFNSVHFPSALLVCSLSFCLFFFFVVEGAHKRTGSTSVQQTFRLKNLHIHAGFTMQNLRDDIAVLELDGRVKLSDKVNTVCLPNGDVAVGAKCYITGEELDKWSVFLRFLEKYCNASSSVVNVPGEHYVFTKISSKCLHVIDAFCGGFEYM